MPYEESRPSQLKIFTPPPASGRIIDGHIVRCRRRFYTRIHVLHEAITII